MDRREKALPACADPDCTKDAIFQGRWCILHKPQPEPIPCDAKVRRGEDLVACGVLDTMEITPHWRAVARKLHRCSTHRTTAWLRTEFQVKS